MSAFFPSYSENSTIRINLTADQQSHVLYAEIATSIIIKKGKMESLDQGRGLTEAEQKSVDVALLDLLPQELNCEVQTGL